MVNKNFLEGKNINLRPLSTNDITEDYIGWLNDSKVCKYNSHHIFPYNKHQADEFVRDISLSKDKIVLIIIHKKSKKHIGNISLQKIDLINSSSEFAILLGDRNYWGKGISKEASLLLIMHGFLELNLHRIYCGTAEENIPMQKLALSLGMTEEGRRKDAQYKNGKFNDIIEYGVIKEDFINKHKVNYKSHVLKTQ